MTWRIPATILCLPVWRSQERSDSEDGAGLERPDGYCQVDRNRVCRPPTGWVNRGPYHYILCRASEVECQLDSTAVSLRKSRYVGACESWPL